MNQPIRYARPHITTAPFGSPLLVEVIVPTIIIGCAAAQIGLSRLLDMVKQVMLSPSSIATEREKNKRDQKQAEIERLAYEEQLARPDDVKRRAYIEQRAQIADAKAREVRAIADAAELLDHMDPELLARVQQVYGDGDTNLLINVARRSEGGSRPAARARSPAN